MNRFVLDALFERPVQAKLVELLLLQQGDRDFASCVLVHGMGGTGKTVTAVAVVQDSGVRRFMSEIYWLTVGADAVGERIAQLQAVMYKQLTGKGTQDEEKDELQQLLLSGRLPRKYRSHSWNSGWLLPPAP